MRTEIFPPHISSIHQIGPKRKPFFVCARDALQEEGLEVALVQIFGDVAGHGCGAGIEHFQVARALLGGDFVADMQ
jgi:hypothetical protein